MVFKLDWKGLKYEVPSTPPILRATCFHADILLSLFDPEDGGDIFLRYVGWLSTDYTA
jgi:hypothetical protein